MNIITIDKSNFLKGQSTTKYLDDGGFSPDSLGFEINNEIYLGLLLAGKSLTLKTSNLGTTVIASCFHIISGVCYYYFIDASGKIYESAVSDITTTLKATESVKTYDNQSDIISYNDNLFATSTTDIMKSDFSFTGSDPIKDWWTVTKSKAALTSGVPHLLFEFNGVLYITNGNKLASWDGTTANDAILILPTGWVITAVEILNNRIYLAASQKYQSGMENFNIATKIFIWDGYSASWIDEKKIKTQPITAMIEIDGLIYFFASHSIYIFDGYSYKKLKYINIIITKHKISACNGMLYYALASEVGCYDSILKSFSTPIKHGKTVSVLKIGYLTYVDLITAEGKGYRCVDNKGTGSFYSNPYTFAQPVYIRKIEILFSTALVTGATYDIKILDEKETAITALTKTVSYAVDGAIIKKEYQIDQQLDYFRIQVDSNHADNSPIRWIKIYYEPSEQDESK